MKTNNPILELRERKRLTQKALAAELDISVATINRIENGIKDLEKQLKQN